MSRVSCNSSAAAQDGHFMCFFPSAQINLVGYIWQVGCAWRTASLFLLRVFYPVPLANVGDDFAHGDLAIRGAFKIADNFTGGHQPFKPLLGDGVLNVTGSVWFPHRLAWASPSLVGWRERRIIFRSLNKKKWRSIILSNVGCVLSITWRITRHFFGVMLHFNA